MRKNKDNKIICTRDDLAYWLYQESAIIKTKKQANELSFIFINFFQEALIQSNIVEIKGLGVFEKYFVKPRKYIVPRKKVCKSEDGKRIEKSIKFSATNKGERIRVKFKMSQTLKNLLNNKQKEE